MKTQKKQVFNPYLPLYEYVPDGEPYVYEDRLYIFGSHDRFDGENFCQNDYVLWSCPADDLSDWRFEGTIYRKNQDPELKKGGFLQAPDVARGKDGRFYLYYTMAGAPFTSIAVSEQITGPYEYYGTVQTKNGHVLGKRLRDVFQFDPAVMVDDDGRVFMYTGFAPECEGIMRMVHASYKACGSYVIELEEDMKTVKSMPRLIIPGITEKEKRGFGGHEFYEASSMRKIKDTYYFIYSSILSHELCYATSSYPDRDFVFQGTLVSIGDVGLNGRTEKEALNYLGNTHGSVVNVNNQWYVFYHRQTNKCMFSRQACAEKIEMDEEGKFVQAEITSCGLSQSFLAGKGRYPAAIACNLMSGRGACTYTTNKFSDDEGHPYFTQTGQDRESEPDQYIANMRDGAIAGYKYFTFTECNEIAVLLSGSGKGTIKISTEMGEEPVCEIKIDVDNQKKWEKAKCVKALNGSSALYFQYTGTGAVNFHEFELYEI